VYYDFNEGHAFIAERKSAGSEWKIRDIVYPDNLVVATRIFFTNAAGDLVGAYNYDGGPWMGFVAKRIR